MKYNFLNKFYHEYLSLFSTVVKTISRNLKNEKFEPEVAVLNRIISPGAICFDIGGAYGRYALPLSRIVKGAGKVFSFEPGRYSFRVLSFVKKFHKLNNVSIYKIALSNKSGSINLCLPVKKTGKIGASLAFISEASHNDMVCERIDMATLDNFCTQKSIGQVNFIKCDTEGSEILVFMGAENTIRKYRPVILTEVDAGNMSRYGYKPSDLERFFKALSYKILSYKEGNFLYHKNIAKDGNYFLVPEEKNLREVYL